jgi:hypothetical protein
MKKLITKTLKVINHPAVELGISKSLMVVFWEKNIRDPAVMF